MARGINAASKMKRNNRIFLKLTDCGNNQRRAGDEAAMAGTPERR
jgi:hypothetical protein